MKDDIPFIFDYCITYKNGEQIANDWNDKSGRMWLSRAELKALIYYLIDSDGDLNSTDLPGLINGVVTRMKEESIKIVNEKYPSFKDEKIYQIEISVNLFRLDRIQKNDYYDINGKILFFTRNDGSTVELIVDGGWVEIYDSRKPYQYAELEKNYMADLLSELIEK